MANPDKDAAFSYLQKDELHHADMLENLKKNHAELIAATPQGVALFSPTDRTCFLSARSAQAAANLMRDMPKFDLLVAHQQSYVEDFLEKFNLDFGITVYQSVYTAGEPLALANPSLVIRLLNEAYLDLLARHYTFVSEDYIAERLGAGAMWGGFLEGELAGTIGIHTEGSLGLLRTLPVYRRGQVASTLVAYLVNQYLANGLLPFGQVEPKNKASIALQEQLGFTLSRKKLYWLESKAPEQLTLLSFANN